ncbi:Asp-tRNA(Asn)/Glu-tRNA(Gln) amidotransferase subunit GatB [Candidatus Daviesbacteria bacterium]|nr:Asp-tRNA(Asn)/Glu-tRNA(Gln) amidotransferase subunit GatB [Candidatus Daviesbacteria bacterium]
MKYEPVIGMEVHVELNTKSKMFCRCSADYFGKEPNTHTCPICLGLPGALPVPNKKALEYCMMIGLALGCKINEKSLFERKNYFYPDLPKGYQISQYRWPLCVNGWMEVEGKEGKRRISINRAHQEEDTGKLSHARGETLIDFNRSGVPLVEIVTEPDFRGVEEVRDYAKKLQQLFRYLGVSNADMERGDMRLEANVSVRPEGTTDLPNYRVELKNINSFRFMVAAVEYEIKRQIVELEAGKKLTQETRGWNEQKKETYLQRSKGEAHDYRYFPEPDIPELRIDNEQWTKIKEKLPELPWDKADRFQKEYGLTKQQVEILTQSLELALFYEEAVKDGKPHGVDALQIANHIINKKINIEKVLPAQVVAQILQSRTDQITDEKELEKLSKEAIAENPQAVADYKKGKETALQALIGAVMKKTLGKAEANKARSVLKKLLE